MNVDTQLEDALTVLTDTLMSGSGEAGMRRVSRAFDRAMVEPYIPLLLDLQHAYEPVVPSSRFIRQLHEDLIGEPERGLIAKARSMPPRVQFAAGAVAVLSVVLIVIRWMSGFFSSRSDEEADAVVQTEISGGA